MRATGFTHIESGKTRIPGLGFALATLDDEN